MNGTPYISNDTFLVKKMAQQFPPNNEGLLDFDTWNQRGIYNDYSPKVLVFRCATGCVATALGQLLYYWEYPKSVNFSSSIDKYTSEGNNIIVDTDATAYDFPTFNMLSGLLNPIKYDFSNQEKAMLSFACGVSTKMNYGVFSSGANPVDLFNAITDKWEYGSADYSEDWTDEIKSTAIQNIKDGMPVLIGLYQTQEEGGHRVLVEGYDDVTDNFLINMGWGSNNDGLWFDLGNPLTGRPASVGKYNMVGNIIYNIHPETAWNQAYGNSENTKFSPYAAPSEFKEKWKITHGKNRTKFEGIISGKGGKIYALAKPMDLNQGQKSYLFTIDNYGTNHYEMEINDELVIDGDAGTYPAQGFDGGIYFATTYKLYKCDSESKAIDVIKTISAPEGFEKALRLDNEGNIYISSIENLSPYTNRVRSFSSDGSERWVYTIPTGGSSYREICVDSSYDRVFVNYYNSSLKTGHLVMLDSKNGHVLGSRTWNDIPYASEVGEPSVGSDGIVYIGMKTILYALEPDISLSIKWEKDLPLGYIAESPTVVRDKVYVANWGVPPEYNISSIDVDNGNITWQYKLNLGNYDNIRGNLLVGANSVLSFLIYRKDDESSTLYSLQDNGNTYEFLDSVKYNIQEAFNLALGPNNTLYVIGEERVLALTDGERGNPFRAGMGFVNNRPPQVHLQISSTDESDPTSATLSWQSIDPDGHDMKYSLYLGSREIDDVENETPSGGMKLIASNINSTEYHLEDMQNGKEYYWQVIATDGQAVSTAPSGVQIIPVGVEEENTSLPMMYDLKQNVPNPFNPSTKIYFSVPAEGHVSLEVFNLLGQRVDILVSEILPPGNRSTIWNATNVPAGSYFCRLRSGDFTKTIKMTVVK
ncbi:C10 family peptidase [Candidatus Latescibacterota bacterium]